MPWKSSDAHAKTHKAKSPKAKRQWAHVANSVLKRTGDEGKAVAAANSVIKRRMSGESHNYDSSRAKRPVVSRYSK